MKEGPERVEPPGTDRIRLRRIRADDLDAFCDLDADGGVLRFLAREPAARKEQESRIRALLDEHDRWPGHGRFVAESPAVESLGWFGLRVGDDPLRPSLGYRLHPRFWGRGSATERGRALVEWIAQDRRSNVKN